MRGSIRKRSQGSWTLEVAAGFEPVSGKRQRVFRTVRGTKRDAERALAELIAEVERGTNLDAGKVTAAAYIDRWLQHARSRVRPRTWYRYAQLLRDYVVPILQPLVLSKIRPAHVQAVLDEMSKKGLSPRTTIQCYRVMRSALQQAVRWQLIATNPAQAIQPPRASRPDLRIPDSRDLARLVEISSKTPQAVPMLVAVTSGLRRGELLGLRWQDLDLDAARLRVNNSLQRIPGEPPTLQLVEPKTQRARREIALPRQTVDRLRKHRREQAERRLILGEAWTDLDLVFDRGDGRPVNPDTFTSAFERIAKRANLEGVRFHDLRHGYATALLVQGVHPKIASEALGHSSVAFTLDTYSHVVAGLQDRAADAIERALAEATAVNLPSS